MAPPELPDFVDPMDVLDDDFSRVFADVLKEGRESPGSIGRSLDTHLAFLRPALDDVL